MIHELKCWPGPFAALLDGSKRHEVRRADRPFVAGDRLRLREWDPGSQEYTDRELTLRVTYLTPAGQWGLPDDVCVMSVEVTDAPCPRTPGCRKRRRHRGACYPAGAGTDGR